jgi:hypothetical protein
MLNSDWSVNITLVDIEANCCAATLGTCVCVCVYKPVSFLCLLILRSTTCGKMFVAKERMEHVIRSVVALMDLFF